MPIRVGQLAIPAELLAIPEVVNIAIPDIADAVRNEIIRLAHTTLHTSSQDYVAGVSAVRYHHPSGNIPTTGNVKVATVVLTGMLPNMIEAGWAGGDMKPALLAGRNAKMGKDGKRYNTVPFRHGAPGATGRNFPAMGTQYAGTMGAQAAARLGKAVHQAAKKLTPTRKTPGGPTSWGGRLSAGHAPKLKQHHSTDLYAGMVRQQKKYARSTQSSYFTFRRVSDNSDAQKWIHPGIPAANLFEKAAQYAAQIAPSILREAINGD